MSIVLHPDIDVSKITLVPIAAAVALANAIEKTLALKTELKWPNDITLNGKKIAGIIIDASIESSKIDNIVLGIGINYNVNPAEIEKKIRTKANYYGVGTLVKNYKQKPAKLVRSFLEELERILRLLADGKSQLIITQWTKRSSTIGKNVTVSGTTGIATGRAVRIDDDGSLVLKQRTGYARISAGDISY